MNRSEKRQRVLELLQQIHASIGRRDCDIHASLANMQELYALLGYSESDQESLKADSSWLLGYSELDQGGC